MPERIAFVLLAATLIIAGIIDWRRGVVYNKLNYPAIAVGLLYWTFSGYNRGGAHGAVDGLVEASLALAVGLVPFAIIFACGGLGGGDVKLMGAVGALSGSFECVLETACYAFLFAAMMAVFIMFKRRIVIRTLSRIITAMFFAASKVRPSPFVDSSYIPFSVAIAAGGLIAAANHLLNLRLPWSAWGP